MARIQRRTKETDITLELDLEGEGTCDADTTNAFLDHMLASLARYAGWDLRVRAKGDLDHHLVEDVAIALGQAFRQAFAGRPCVRIAHDIVPMDDVLMVCAVDLVDRPYYAGGLEIPLWDHWFRSFATEARINLHLDQRRGRDPHHAVEAAFKALGRSIKTALTPRDEEISTKGTVQVKTERPASGGKATGPEP